MVSKRKLLLFGGLITLAVAATVVDVLVLYPNRAHAGSGAIRRVQVPEGVGPRGLASLLDETGLIDSPGRFVAWLRATGSISRVRAGTFDLTDRMSPSEIVGRLSRRGVDKGVKIVFPEGVTLDEMAKALNDKGVLDKDAFLSAATSADLVNALGAPGPTFEGYLFPDTYYFDVPTPPRTVIGRLYDAFNARLNRLEVSRGGALRELVTLASIVQAETPVTAEMPVVAGVYRNRLESAQYPSRLLQADPTVSYGCRPFIAPRAPSCATFKGILGRKQLDDPANPYNTYRHPGLPPGPICAPGATALQAAAAPKDVPYFYFVASPRQDGTHVFSETLDAHRAAVEAYRKRTTGLSKEGLRPDANATE